MIPVNITPDTAYATKDNILFPGNATQATAAETRAVAAVNDRLPRGATVTGLRVLRS